MWNLWHHHAHTGGTERLISRQTPCSAEAPPEVRSAGASGVRGVARASRPRHTPVGPRSAPTRGAASWLCPVLDSRAVLKKPCESVQPWARAEASGTAEFNAATHNLAGVSGVRTRTGFRDSSHPQLILRSVHLVRFRDWPDLVSRTGVGVRSWRIAEGMRASWPVRAVCAATGRTAHHRSVGNRLMFENRASCLPRAQRDDHPGLAEIRGPVECPADTRLAWPPGVNGRSVHLEEGPGREHARSWL